MYHRTVYFTRTASHINRLHHSVYRLHGRAHRFQQPVFHIPHRVTGVDQPGRRVLPLGILAVEKIGVPDHGVLVFQFPRLLVPEPQRVRGVPHLADPFVAEHLGRRHPRRIYRIVPEYPLPDHVDPEVVGSVPFQDFLLHRPGAAYAVASRRREHHDEANLARIAVERLLEIDEAEGFRIEAGVGAGPGELGAGLRRPQQGPGQDQRGHQVDSGFHFRRSIIPWWWTEPRSARAGWVVYDIDFACGLTSEIFNL